MAARKAASVLPEPVGAAIRVWRPAWISGQARACGSVGEPKRFSNQEATAGWKLASGMVLLLWRKTGGRSPGRITGTEDGGFPGETPLDGYSAIRLRFASPLDRSTRSQSRRCKPTCRRRKIG